MKKLILLISLFLPLMAFAGPLSNDDALRYAQDFFGLDSKRDLEIVWTGNNTQEPAFYVVNYLDKGFVMLSGEECVEPVLGYSRENAFTVKGMPEAVRSWFGTIENDIKYVRGNLSREVTSAQKAKWQNLDAVTKAGVEYVLETAEWDQSAPYNDLCVISKGGKQYKGLTGCVATALSIYCRYMKYPEHGVGTVNGYTTGDGYSVDGVTLDDHYYKWDLMPIKDADVKKASAEAKLTLATIMHDCGVILKMDYSPDGSGTSTQYIVSQAAKHLGYCKDANFFHKSLYSTEEWLALMTEAINKQRPIIYSGQDSNGGGGHCFILDGYDGQGKFHVNWGWGGASKGFYTLDLKVQSYRFANDCGALVDLLPDPNGTSGDAKYDIFITDYNGGKGLTLSSGKVVKGKSFSLDIKYICNPGYAAYNGSLKAALVAQDGTVKEFISAAVPFQLQASTGKSYSLQVSAIPGCIITSDIDFTDRIAVFYEDYANGAWQLLRHDREGSAKGYIAAIPYTFIVVKDSYKVGDVLTFELIDGADGYESVTWYLDNKKNTTGTETLAAGRHTIKAVLTRKGGSETIIQEIEVK